MELSHILLSTLWVAWMSFSTTLLGEKNKKKN